MSYRILIKGAFGRTYSNAAQVLSDWNANKDFLMIGEQWSYISKSSFEKYGKTFQYVQFQGEDFSVTFWQ